MAGKRKYDEACAAAHGLDLVGERWALLVVRELLLGPKRFTDLRGGLPGISPNVLTQRLEELETAGVLRRRKLPPPASVWVYELTEWGQELEPVIRALGRWGARSPHRSADAVLGVDSLILSFRTMFDAAAAYDFDASVELRICEDVFHAQVLDGQLEVVRGQASGPDAIIAGDAMAVASVVYGGRKLTDAMRAGDIVVEGDKNVVKRFLALFPLPQPVG